MDQVITKFLEYGGLSGAILVTMGFYIWSQTKRINKMTDDRFDDSKDQIEAMNKLGNVIEQLSTENRQNQSILREAIHELKYQIESLKDLIRGK